MAVTLNKLSPRAVTTIRKPGRHSDGGGLYLVVDASGARRWLFMFRWGGKLKEMGLGGIATTSLAEARATAEEARKAVKAGRNPIDERRRKAEEQNRAITFGDFADQLLPELSRGFRNAKHAAQWVSTLNTYAADIRKKLIAEIGTDDVLAALQPIWTTKAETASRVRGRIERILDAAKAKGLRSGENPARWRGHLDNLLPRRKKLQRGHHAAMPFADVPAFMTDLRERPALAALALEFTILTAARSNEVFGARWDEIDRKAKVWIVPAGRMKAGREHRVPLSALALAVLDKAEAIRGDGDLVFPGQKKGRPLSVMAMDMLLRRMKLDVTVHGFRSSFRDWCGEATTFPRDLAEQALAHVVGDETERAYRRGDALEKRRKLMDAWAAYLARGKAKNTGNVVEMKRA